LKNCLTKWITLLIATGSSLAWTLGCNLASLGENSFIPSLQYLLETGQVQTLSKPDNTYIYKICIILWSCKSINMRKDWGDKNKQTKKIQEKQHWITSRFSYLCLYLSINPGMTGQYFVKLALLNSSYYNMVSIFPCK
jgi:hypothetical protein